VADCSTQWFFFAFFSGDGPEYGFNVAVIVVLPRLPFLFLFFSSSLSYNAVSGDSPGSIRGRLLPLFVNVTSDFPPLPRPYDRTRSNRGGQGDKFAGSPSPFPPSLCQRGEARADSDHRRRGGTLTDPSRRLPPSLRCCRGTVRSQIGNS